MPTESHPELGKVVYILVTDGTPSFPLQPTEWRRKRKSREGGVIIIGYELFRILSDSSEVFMRTTSTTTILKERATNS